MKLYVLLFFMFLMSGFLCPPVKAEKIVKESIQSQGKE
jgi:hypothetical protein